MWRNVSLTLGLMISVSASISAAYGQAVEAPTLQRQYKIGLVARDAVESHLRTRNVAFFGTQYLAAKKKSYPLVIFIPGIL